MFRYFFNPLSHRCAMPAPPNGELFEVRESFRLKCKACGRARSPLGGAVAQRLRGFKSAEPEKTVKRSSRRSGVNLQFFPVEPTSLGLKGASSPFFVAPARRNRWHFSGSLLVSKENIPRRTAHNIKKRPALPVEMRGALVIQAYASGWGCAAEDWAAMNSAASSGMSSKSASLPMSTLSGGFLNRISYRMGTIYRVIRVA